MTKAEFMIQLRKNLSGLPKRDIEDRLNFYSEMIDDRVEEGKTEVEAVLEIGSVEEVSSQIIAEIPFMKIAKERIKSKRRLKAWEIVLLVLASPIWVALLIAAFSVILSLYAVLWSLIASVWAIFAALVACAVGSGIAGIFGVFAGGSLGGVAMIGVGVFCAGLAIFLFFGSISATKGNVILIKRIALGLKKCFVKREVYNG